MSTIALSRSCLAGVCLLLFGLPMLPIPGCLPASPARGHGGDRAHSGGEDVARQVGRANPQVRITVTGGGSGVGIQKVGEGLVDIGSTGRAPSEAEIQRYDLKPFRFVLRRRGDCRRHPSNPVGNLSMEQARDIFSGKIGTNPTGRRSGPPHQPRWPRPKPAPPAKCLSARCWARTCSRATRSTLLVVQRGGQDGHCP